MADDDRRGQRRALTPARAPTAIATWGDAGKAAALARALDVSRAVTDEAIREYTHGFHTYPARMHPHTARRALAALQLGKGDLVVDPFCGSGTVLVESLLAGARAAGVDASPLAILVAKARTWAAPPARRKLMVNRAREIAARVIAEGKAARRADHEKVAWRGNAKRGEKLAGWFDPHVRREVEALAAAVDAVSDEEIRDVLRAVLSSILIKVSRRASDTRAERITRKIGRGLPARFFADRAEELARGLAALWKQAPAGAADIHMGDARQLDLAAGSAAAVVTSPPYAGTYDYFEHHGLRLAFLGIPATGFASKEIGARRGFTGDPAGALTAWERDLAKVLAGVHRVLRPGGAAVILVGDSLAGTVAVHGDQTVARLAPAAGLELTARASARRPVLGGAEIRAFRDAAKQEHLIRLEKPR